MLALRSHLSILRPLRFLLIAFTCAVLFLAPALPAAAARSNPTQGEAQLKDIESKSIDVLEAGKPYSLKKTQEGANQGLNEVQGAANIDQMKRPSNSTNAPASVEQKIQKGLEKLQDKASDAAKSAKNLVD